MAEAVQTAAELLRSTRRRAGLTQRELAARAGVTQSVVSAYESGRRQPAFETLRRLIGATGHRVQIELTADAMPSPPGELGHLVERHREEIKRIAASHGARNVRIFGGVARGDERRGSDVDVLVDMEPTGGLFALMRLEHDLRELIGVDVDVIPADSLKPEVRAAAEGEVVTL